MWTVRADGPARLVPWAPLTVPLAQGRRHSIGRPTLRSLDFRHICALHTGAAITGGTDRDAEAKAAATLVNVAEWRFLVRELQAKCMLYKNAIVICITKDQ